ncbi:MAG: MerR family transcriptional regulator [Thermodesulfobacteriota bacterium]|nr:MerR family transcriptional regulator [Thermodesulfobacteriota bacterium]
MKERLYLNKDAASIAGISPRALQSWSDKGVIRPAREASGGGTKRGYDYLNLIEASLAQRLLWWGLGIQSVKGILGDIRDKNLLAEWLENTEEFFRKQWLSGVLGFGGAAYTKGQVSSRQLEKNKHWAKITNSLHHMFILEPPKEEKLRGALFYFMGGALKGRPFIFPWARLKLGASEKLLEASHVLYSFITQYEEGVIIVNIGTIKERIDQVLAS